VKSTYHNLFKWNEFGAAGTGFFFLQLVKKIIPFADLYTMPELKKTFRTCKKGHAYYKSSDCPTCPICEAARKGSSTGFLSLLSAPARRALENKGISTLKQLAAFTEKEILALHGMGPATIPILKKALKEEELAFKK
jgi:hypothetical protein